MHANIHVEFSSYMYMYTCIMIVFLVLCILSCSSVHQYNEEVLMVIKHLNVFDFDLYINFKCKKTQWNIHYSHVAVHILGHTADIYQH